MAKPALTLDPKFALHPKIEMKEVEVEIERAIWKARGDFQSNITSVERGSLKAVKEMKEAGVNIVRPADKANASVFDPWENYKTLDGDSCQG